MSRAWFLLLASALVVTAGCLAEGGDEGSLESSEGGDEEPLDGSETEPVEVTVEWEVANASENLRSVRHVLFSVLLDPAGPDDAPRLLWTGETAIEPLEASDNRTQVATGTVPADEYESLILRWGMGSTSSRLEVVREGGAPPEDGPTFDPPEAHSTRPVDEEPFQLPVDLVAHADIELADDANIRLVQDARGDLEVQGFTVSELVITDPQGTRSLDHRIELADELAEPDAAPPEANFDLRTEDGRELGGAEQANASFVNGRSSPVAVWEGIVLDRNASRPGSAAEEIVWASVSKDGEWKGYAMDSFTDRSTLRFRTHGVHEVTLRVGDDAGGVASKTLRVVTEHEGWSQPIRFDDLEDATAWSTKAPPTPPGNLTRWEIDHFGNRSDRVFHAAYPDDIERQTAAYGPDAEAVLTSPATEIPDWPSAGYRLWLTGASQPPDHLRVELLADGETREIANLTGTEEAEEWRRFAAPEGLSEFTNSTVRFRFTFVSDETGQEGIGWALDALHVGGVDHEPVNPGLLAQAPP